MNREEAVKEIRKSLEEWDQSDLIQELILHIEGSMDSWSDQDRDWSDFVKFYAEDDDISCVNG